MPHQFDIFARALGSRPSWLGVAYSLSKAIDQMKQYARTKPGRYFVYSLDRKNILASIDTDAGEAIQADIMRRDRNSVCLMHSAPGWHKEVSEADKVVYRNQDSVITIFPDGSWECVRQRGAFVETGQGTPKELERFLRCFCKT